MTFNTIAAIVDLDRYPINQPGSATVAALLRDGQAALGRNALYTLPGFVRPEAVSFMADELAARVPQACRLESTRGAYYDDHSIWPPDHPRSATHYSRYFQVLNHQIPNDSPLRLLFGWEPLREFLRRLIDYETFYRSECPHLALTAKVAGDGDTDGWHFDGNDVVFSILLQKPDDGGVFEYIPKARSDDDEDYDRVAAAFAGDQTVVRSAALNVGDLNVFQGNETLHRVSPVKGAGQRIVGLFSYDRQPATTFGESYIAELRRHMPGR